MHKKLFLSLTLLSSVAYGSANNDTGVRLCESQIPGAPKSFFIVEYGTKQADGTYKYKEDKVSLSDAREKICVIILRELLKREHNYIGGAEQSSIQSLSKSYANLKCFEFEDKKVK